MYPTESRSGGVAGLAIAAPPTELRRRMLSAIAAVLDVSPDLLSDDSSPASVPTWDSLNHLNIAMAVESEFAVSLTPDQVMAMGSVALIAAALREQGINL